jgi:hypothetical protein
VCGDESLVLGEFSFVCHFDVVLMVVKA